MIQVLTTRVHVDDNMKELTTFAPHKFAISVRQVACKLNYREAQQNQSIPLEKI